MLPSYWPLSTIYIYRYLFSISDETAMVEEKELLRNKPTVLSPSFQEREQCFHILLVSILRTIFSFKIPTLSPFHSFFHFSKKLDSQSASNCRKIIKKLSYMTEKLVTSACCQLPFGSFDNEVSLEVTFPRGRQNCEKEFKIKSPWYCLIISSF